MAENSTETKTAPEPASKEERASEAPPIMDPPVSVVCMAKIDFCVCGTRDLLC